MVRQREFDTEQALDAATEVFWRQGYEGTSAQDLCEATGLGRGSLYNAFTSKRELYLRVLRRYSELGLAPMIDLLGGTEPVKDRLRVMMMRGIDIDLGDGPRKGCLAVNAATELADHDEEVRDLVAAHFVRVEDEIAAVITQGRTTGELDPTRDTATAAKSVMSTYYGLRLLAAVPQDRKALVAVIDTTLAAL